MQTTRSWIVPVLAIALPLNLVVLLAAAVPRSAAPQDPAPVFRSSDVVAPAEDRYRIATLTYRPIGVGQTHTIAARDIQRIWLSVRPDGGTQLEVLYENGDFKLAHVAEVLMVAQSTEFAAREVPVFRRPMSAMAFPSLK